MLIILLSVSINNNVHLYLANFSFLLTDLLQISTDNMIFAEIECVHWSLILQKCTRKIAMNISSCNIERKYLSREFWNFYISFRRKLFYCEFKADSTRDIFLSDLKRICEILISSWTSFLTFQDIFLFKSQEQRVT